MVCDWVAELFDRLSREWGWGRLAVSRVLWTNASGRLGWWVDLVWEFDGLALGSAVPFTGKLAVSICLVDVHTGLVGERVSGLATFQNPSHSIPAEHGAFAAASHHLYCLSCTPHVIPLCPSPSLPHSPLSADNQRLPRAKKSRRAQPRSPLPFSPLNEPYVQPPYFPYNPTSSAHTVPPLSRTEGAHNTWASGIDKPASSGTNSQAESPRTTPRIAFSSGPSTRESGP